jgi:putative ABC transport system permease protein
MGIWARIKAFGPWSRELRERDLDREIRRHLDLEAEETGKDGAQRLFGNATLVKEDVRAEWGWTRLEQLARDVRYGIRQVRRNPGFSAVATVTLALGIGVNAAMFSAVHAVLIRPLPYADAGRLVMIWDDLSKSGDQEKQFPAPVEWLEWRRQNTVFIDIAATQPGKTSISGEGEPEQVPSRKATGNLWSVLGVQPVLGRVFSEEEDEKSIRVAVISHGLWQRRFGGSPGVIGRTMMLNDVPYEIVGVMPRDFYFMPGRDIDIWIPASFPAWMRRNFGWHDAQIVARLKPGVTVEQAHASMAPLSLQITANATNPHAVVVTPLREELAGKTQAALVVLLCASAAVLMIACVNLVNLLMSRGRGRERETAVRAALGAGRGRLVTQFLVESLVLSAIGTAAGLVLAIPAMRFLERMVPDTMAAVRLTLDWRVLSFSAAIAIAATLAFGLAPALRRSHSAMQQGLREAGRGNAGTQSYWLQHSLIVGETAMAVALLTCGGLLLQTLHHLRKVDLGIRTERLLTFETPLFRYSNFERRVAFVNSEMENIRAIPGVINAGAISRIPLTVTDQATFYQFEGQPTERASEQVALTRVVTRDYFATVGARLREGRFFDVSDRKSDAPAAIVNESFANRHFPESSPLGRKLQFGEIGDRGYWYTIVGVVREIRDRGVAEEAKPTIYRVHEQADQSNDQPSGIVVRTAVEPGSIVFAVRQAIWSIDKDQPVARVQTMEEIVDRQLSTPSQSTALLSAFALFALLLASVGLYGVLSHAVTQRTNEIGVRMALGATSREILLSFGGRGMLLTLAGLAIGSVLSVAGSRLMTALLYGFPPDYVPAIVTVSLTLLSVAAVACLVPARRASRIDPLIALRHE